MGYHPVTLPPQFSQGSQFSVGYDTRITTLESGVETRMSKYRPEGRRRYSLLKGIASQEDILELYEFFMLRQGALNSFRMRDWMDYTTSPSRVDFTPDAVPVGPFDSTMTNVTGRSFQMTSTYQDSARTIVRPLYKIVPFSDRVAVNGVEVVRNTDYTINYETGQVEIDSGLGQIQSVTGGCNFFVTVRFAEETDRAFSVAMQATDDTQSIPGFDVIEDVAPDAVSQDYQYGGSQGYLNVNSTIRIVEVQGRLQLFEAVGQEAVAVLPPTLDIPNGGPIFVIQNIGTENLTISDQDLNVVQILTPGNTAQLFLSNLSGLDTWLVLV